MKKYNDQTVKNNKKGDQIKQTWLRLDIPRTKQIASNILLLPVPFKPVIALN